MAYLLIYLGAGLLGSALSLSFAAQHAIGVGASGAVFGVAGAWLVAIRQYRGRMPETLSKRLLTQIGLFVLYSLVQGLTKPGVDNAAHVGGLIGGCLLACILPARLDMDRYRRRLPGRAAMALAATGAGIAVLAMLAPRAALDHRQFFASAEAVARGFSAVERGAGHGIGPAGLCRRTPVGAPMGRAQSRRPRAGAAAGHGHAALSQARARRPARGPATRHPALRRPDGRSDGTDGDGAPESRDPVSTDPARLAHVQRQLEAVGERLTRDADALRRRPFN